jgi:hypothetical protein
MGELFFSLGVAFVLASMQTFFESTFITQFLKQNLVTLLVALLAINCTTMGIVLSKIKEIINISRENGAFNRTKKEMIKSVNEQIGLIVLSLLLLLIQDSKWLNNYLWLSNIIQILIMACFVFGITILYDTAKSVFVIIDYNHEQSN